MPEEPVKPDAAPPPSEKDAAQEIGGRQPQRPGQDGRYQPRPGQRDPDTLPSRD
jgi:hypothetical protein